MTDLIGLAVLFLIFAFGRVYIGWYSEGGI